MKKDIETHFIKVLLAVLTPVALLFVSICFLMPLGSSLFKGHVFSDLILNDFTDEEIRIFYNEFSLDIPEEIKPTSFSYHSNTAGLVLTLRFSGNDLEPFLAAYDNVEELRLTPDQHHKGMRLYNAIGKDGKTIWIAYGEERITFEKRYVSTKEFKDMPKDYGSGWEKISNAWGPD